MNAGKFVNFTTEEMLALEKLASEKYGVSTDQMMQNAGRALHDFVAGELSEVRRVLVLAGKGNNGGDAMAAADLLRESGYEVVAVRVEAPFEKSFDFSRFDLIIDGLFGFSLKGNPRPPIDKIIEQINCSKVPVLAVDVPSGLEVFSGKIMKPIVKATYTLSLGMLKKGLRENPDYAGKICLGNLGIPSIAYAERGIAAPDFSEKNYVLIG
ncbi:NAD(P)H-hydrate epimerase [Candidatus Peregrinibacteria bacterium]|nr:NAD(P)H-hydrate epimerase [Candidatus Peregrinibacteria bacterium]